MRLVSAILLIGGICFARSAEAQQYPQTFIYEPQSYSDGSFPVPPSAAANPVYAGVSISLLWNKLQPTNNFALSPDWSLLDSFLNQMKAAEGDYQSAPPKKLVITIVAGSYTPTWIYAQNSLNKTAVSGAFYSSLTTGDGNQGCMTGVLFPIPYLGDYASIYGNVMSQLATHLATFDPARNWLNQVVAVKNGSIGLHSPEFALPVAAGCGGTQNNNNSLWLNSYGYTAGALKNAWLGIETSLANTFPNALLVQDVLATSGAEIPNADTTFPVNILNAGRNSAFGSRFVAATDDITAPIDLGSPHTNSVLQYLALHSASSPLVAWQFNNWAAPHGAGCGTYDGNTASTCTITGFSEILFCAAQTGAQWVEIHHGDPTGSYVTVTACPASPENP